MATTAYTSQTTALNKPVHVVGTVPGSTAYVTQQPAKQSTIKRVFNFFASIQTLLAELQFLLGSPVLIAGAGCFLGRRLLAAAILYVIAYSLWVGAGLSIIASTFTKLLKDKKIHDGLSFTHSIGYLIATVLLVLGASLYIGPYTNVDGTDFAGLILFVVGAGFFFLASLLRFYVMVSRLVNSSWNTMTNKDKTLGVFYALGASLYLIASVTLVVGAALYVVLSVDFDNAASILWIITGALVFFAALSNIVSRRY
ncbi:hypothetical protein AKO1_008388 [Acrasis kona]|uniref:Transmembrane protein n=1 Tax=Acrasis kona TaxID=1008807 RepID=A0AAW2YMR4_9EUKA